MTSDQDMSRSTHFDEQLRQFREQDEARWKYEAKELERQSKILNESGRTDAQVRAELAAAGINTAELERHAEQEAEADQRVHDALQKVQPPPRSPGEKDRARLQRDVIAPSDTWIVPPAFTGWGNVEDCGFNLALGEWNTKAHRVGDGLGWQATGEAAPQRCTLWFYYIPARAGTLGVEPHVDFQGDVAVSAHDHWYTSTEARLRLQLHFDLYQHYWDGEQIATIIDEDRSDSHSAYWVDDHRVISKSLSVSADDVVWIKLTTSLFASAHSSHAHVDCDFRTGAERRIRVEHIRVNLT